MGLVSAHSTPIDSAAAAAGVPTATLGSVLRTPEVARTLVVSIISRLPWGALGLLVLLRVSEHHSYAQAGLVDAAYGVMVALVGPILSRAVDRRGQTAILVPTAITGGLGTAAIALLPSESSIWLFIVFAAVNGAAQPPLGGAMRAVWDLLLHSDEERHVGYAVDASATEVVWTIGPLVMTGIVAATLGVQAALLLCAACTGLGGLAFALSGPSRRWRSSAVHQDARPRAGAIRSKGVQTLVAVSLGAGWLFGAVEFGTTAFAKEHGGTGTVGLLLGIWAIGSFTAGLLMTRAPAPTNPGRRLARILLFLGVGGLALGLATNVTTLAILLILSGAGIAPMFATVNSAMTHAAAEGTLTEAYALTTTGVFVGAMVGAPLAGLLVDHLSATAALASSGVPAIVLAAVTWVRRDTVSPPDKLAADTAAAAHAPG